MRSPVILSILIVICALAISLWHRLDTLPPHHDESRHLLASLHYFNDLGQSPKERVASLAFKRFESYPPLMYIITIPFYAVAGVSKDVAGMVNILFMAIMILSVYGIGRRLYTEEAGIAAAILATCYPIIVGISKRYVLELPETAMVSLCIYTALRTEGFRKNSWSLLLGVICGMGMLTEWHFPIFCAGPLVYMLIYPHERSLLSPPLSSKRLANFLICMSAALVLSLPWYAYNFARVRAFIIGNITLPARLTPPPVSSVSGLLYYPYAFLDTMLLVPMTILFLIGLITTVSKKKTSPVLILWILVPLAVLTLIRQKQDRYLTPVVPAAAVLTAGGLSLITQKLLKKILICAAFGISALNFILLTFPLPWRDIDISFRLPLYDPTYYSWARPRAEIVRTELPSYGMRPPRHEEWPLESILHDIATFGQGTQDQKVKAGYLLCGHLCLNRYNFFYYTELGTYQIKWVNPDRAEFIITLLATEEQKQQFRKWSYPWLHLQRLKSYILPDGLEAVLYHASLTRRRHYDAHELPSETGGARVEDAASSAGWARFADRDKSAAGAMVKGPYHPLGEGTYRLLVKLKYDRPKGRDTLARMEVRDRKIGKPLASRNLTLPDLGESGFFSPVQLDFEMPERDRVDIRVIHTGQADLWVDSIDIIPLGTGTPHTGESPI